jgi:hypothetical protein
MEELFILEMKKVDDVVDKVMDRYDFPEER